MPKKRKPSQPVDRAAEYIDSPRMTQRLRYDLDVSARIAGNYGTYRTRLRLGDRDTASCTCPSEQFPCKHVRALEATWKQNPESFFNLADLMNRLEKKSKAELLALIGQLALAAPESLVACGVKGFEDELDEDGFDGFEDEEYD